jgi:HK97 family phage major capsid protein
MDLIKALNEATTSAGGYLVPDEFRARLYELINAAAITLPDCETVNMISDTQYTPSVTTGSTAYWPDENGTITAGDAAFGRVTLTAKKVAALMQMSTELLEDNNVSAAEYITRQMAIDLALKVDNEILNGTGTHFSGYRDVATYTDINTVTASTDGDAITGDKIFDGITAITEDNFTPGAIYIHPRTVGALRKLKDTNNRYMFDDAQFGSPILREGAIGTIAGLKVKTSTQLPTTVTKGSTTTCTDLIIVTPGKSGLFGRRRELRFNRFYDIKFDSEYLQANMRCGFTVPYQKSICVIKDITS